MLRVSEARENRGAGLRIRNAAARLRRPLQMTLVMLVLMRAELLASCAPFAAALMAAGLAAGESAAALVLGCVLGMLRLPPEPLRVLPAVSCALVLAAELVLSALPVSGKLAPETRICGVAGFSVLLAALPAAGGAPLPSLQALACAAAAAASAPFLLSALGVHAGRKQLMLQERTGLLLLMGVCVAGLRRILPPLSDFFACLVLLAAPGALTGVALGLAQLLGGAALGSLFPWALLGAATGLRLLNSRWQRSTVVLLLSAVLILAERVSPLGLIPPALAGLLHLLLPEAYPEAIRRLLVPGEAGAFTPDHIAREVTASSRQHLRALGDAFGEMAACCACPVELPGEQELIQQMRTRLCTDCPSYAACWAGDQNRAVRFLCQLITEALERMDAPQGMRVLFSDGEIPPEVLRICRRGRMIPDRLGLLLRDFAEKRRSGVKRCATGALLSAQLAQARELLYDLAEAQAAPVSFHGPRLEQLRAALDSAGLGDCEAAALGMEHAEIRLTRPAPWTSAEAKAASAAFARAFGGGFMPRMQGEALVFAQRTRFHVRSGASCRSGVAGQVCGDSHLIDLLTPSKLALMISDGMGSGEAASAESADALRLLRHLLAAGIARPLALETANRLMLMRSGDELYATVDLCIIDLNTGVAEFSKLAASRSLILRGSEVLRVEGGRLPLGILEQVQPAVTRIRLRPGDVVVLASDGVMDAADGLCIDRAARLNSAAPPDQLAAELVREAASRRSPARSDDMTCICARLEAGR